jgi:hypothetical protein
LNLAPHAGLIEYQLVRRNRIFSCNGSAVGLEIAFRSSNALNVRFRKRHNTEYGITYRAGDGTTVSYYAYLVKVDASIREVVEIDIPLVTWERGIGRCKRDCIPDDSGVVSVRRNINHNIRIVDSICVRKEIVDLSWYR